MSATAGESAPAQTPASEVGTIAPASQKLTQGGIPPDLAAKVLAQDVMRQDQESGMPEARRDEKTTNILHDEIIGEGQEPEASPPAQPTTSGSEDSQPAAQTTKSAEPGTPTAPAREVTGRNRVWGKIIGTTLLTEHAREEER